MIISPVIFAGSCPPHIATGFYFSAVIIGFYLSIRAVLISGILNSSKEWCLKTQRFSDFDIQE